MFAGHRDALFSKLQMNAHTSKIADIYKSMYNLQSVEIYDKVRMLAFNMIKRLAEQRSKRRGEATPNDWRIKSIPPFDSVVMLHQQSHKQLIFSMFQASIFEQNKVGVASKAVDTLFEKPVIYEQDKVNLHESLAYLVKHQIKLDLAPSMRVALASYAKQRKPYLTDQAIQDIIDSLVGIDNDKLFKVMHEKLQNS
jgi:hypothetical protein